ncbi:MAG: CRTAC1 family protein [Acidobacteriota bacterium]
MRSFSRSRRRFLGSLLQAAVVATLPRNIRQVLAASPAPPAFEEIPPEKSGLRWQHVAGLSPEMYMPETLGAGCAFLDYDNDGWMDIYLVNSGPCDFYDPPRPLRNALYRNNRDGTFTDVTEQSGAFGTAYGMGVAVGDYNGDGYPDLYVTQYPRNVLYRNNGDGTFTDVTEEAGVAAPGWTTSAVWFDFDNDGRLDLFVCGFLDFDKSKNIYCGTPEVRAYCAPTVYPGTYCRLFRNNGDGTFTDVSREAGVTHELARAWGAVAADINNDGWLDLFVANDKSPNFLFVNRKGTFEDVGPLSGVAYNAMGEARSGMCVDAADFDQDGWIDLFLSTVDHEMFSLYRNQGNELFEDLSIPSGLGLATVLFSGMGCRFFDYDNDGEIDLILSNGHPDLNIQYFVPDVTYAMRMLLFRNTGRGWENVSDRSGPVFQKEIAARGLALGDFDNDGAVDVLVSVNDGSPILLRNHAARGKHWLGVRLVGRKANIDAIGAKVTVRSGDFQRHRWLIGNGGFLSSHDHRLVFGLGPRTEVDWIEVQWPAPSNRVERIARPPVDRYITIVEGEGRWQ